MLCQGKGLAVLIIAGDDALHFVVLLPAIYPSLETGEHLRPMPRATPEDIGLMKRP